MGAIVAPSVACGPISTRALGRSFPGQDPSLTRMRSKSSMNAAAFPMARARGLFTVDHRTGGTIVRSRRSVVISAAKKTVRAAEKVVPTEQAEVYEPYDNTAPPPPPGAYPAPAPAPQVYYQTQTAPVVAPAPPASSTPPWQWMLIGGVAILGAQQLLKMLGGTKEKLQQAAMQQMMKTMMNQAGMPPMGGAQGGFPGGGFPPQGGFPQQGGGFPQQGGGFSPQASNPFAMPAPPQSAPRPTPPTPTPASKASSTFTEKKQEETKKKSSFQDVDASSMLGKTTVKSDSDSSSQSSPKSSTPPPPSAFSNYKDAEVVIPPGEEDPWAAWGGAPPGADYTSKPPPSPMSGFTLEAFEKMLDDPMMCQMLLPNMPEGMRDPEMIKLMLKNPQARAMLEQQFEQMSNGQMDPAMQETMNNFNMDSPEVKAQFDQMGVSPQEVMAKIMEDPDTAASFQNPKVQAAMMDCSQHPNNISKYQDDPEIMSVFIKLSSMFPGMN